MRLKHGPDRVNFFDLDLYTSSLGLGLGLGLVRARRLERLELAVY